MRYKRVDDILREDRLLSMKLGPPSIAVCRPNQTHVLLPLESVQVTDEIHRRGLDVYTCTKIEVKNIAHGLLVQKLPPTESTVKTKTMKPVLKPVPFEPNRDVSVTALLQERATLIETTIKDHEMRLVALRSELRDCHTALNALNHKKPIVEAPAEAPRSPIPAPVPLKREHSGEILRFRTFMVDLLKQYGTNNYLSLRDKYNDATGNRITKSAAWNRFFSMQVDGLVTFKGGDVVLNEKPQNEPSSQP